jgi:hypothetical protein
MNRCWICGGPSETAEHRIKKSDLVERFGKGPYAGERELFHIKKGRTQRLQGQDSKLVKYAKNLCGRCNNSLTQPFDFAYEEFISWTMANQESVLKHRVIDFEPVFGPIWERKQRDLFKYFAKCFGCRLDEAGRPVPRDVVDLLHKDSFTTALYVTFQVNEDLLLFPDGQSVGTEPLFVHKSVSTGDEFGFQCGNYYRWLTMMYWYQHRPLEPIGARWVADAKHVYLGWYEPLKPDERSRMIARVGSRTDGAA